MVGIVALLPALISAIGGISQLSQSKKYSDSEKPDYKISAESQRRLANAERMAGERNLPGQSLIEDKIKEATAAGLFNLKQMGQSGGQIIEGLTRLIKGERDTMADVGIAAAENYNKNQSMLRNELGVMSAEKEKEWQYDKYMPYLQSQQTARELESAGTQNIMSAVNVAASSYTQEKMWGDYMKMLEGQNIQATPPTTPTTPPPVYKKTEPPVMGLEGVKGWMPEVNPTPPLSEFTKSPGLSLSSYMGNGNGYSDYYDFLLKSIMPDYLR